jgi:hypothetical protein
MSGRSNLQKLLQLRLYTFLSSRWGVAVVVVGLLLCLNTVLQIAHVTLSGHYSELRCMQYGANTDTHTQSHSLSLTLTL